MKILRGHRGDIHCALIPAPSEAPSLQDHLFTSGYDQTIKVWSTQTNSLIQTLSGHTSIVKSLSIISPPSPSPSLSPFSSEETILSPSPSSSYLVSGSWDNTIRIWHISSAGGPRTGRCVHVLHGHTNRIKVVATFFGKHSHQQQQPGFYLLSGGDDSLMKLWIYYPDTNRSFLLGNYEGHQQPVLSLTLSSPSYGSHRRQIASGGADHTIRIWDLSASSLSHDSSLSENLSSEKVYFPKLTLNGHRGPVNTVIFSLIEETKQLFSCSDDTSLVIWDYESGYIIRQLFGHQAMVTSFVSLFRDDNEYLLSVSRDGTLRIWNTKTTTELKKIDCNHASNTSSCSPLLSLTMRENEITGTVIALGGSDGYLRLITRLEDHYVGLGMSGIGLRVDTQSGGQTSPISKVQFVPKTRVVKNLVVGGFDPSSTSPGSAYVQSPDSSHLLPKITAQKRLNGRPLKYPNSSSPNKQQTAENISHPSRSSASQSSSSMPSLRSNPSLANPLQSESILHTLQAKSATALASIDIENTQENVRDIGHDGRAYRKPSDCISPSMTPIIISRSSIDHSNASLHPTGKRNTGHHRSNTTSGNRMKQLPKFVPRQKEFILTVSLFSDPVVAASKKEDKMLRMRSYAPKDASQT